MSKTATKKPSRRKPASAIGKRNSESFFASQLFTLTVLEQISHSGLDVSTLEHCHNAMAVAAAALDKLIVDYPELTSKIETITASFAREPEAVDAAVANV